jgi:adenylylsulfate kinase-like enzyme
MLCVWFTGLPCAGKTTLAVELSKRLQARDESVSLFDGDVVRRDLSADLGFSQEDRHANVLRVASAAREAVEMGSLAICALISPYARSRREARLLIAPADLWRST